jgi:hypothetical protein
MQEHQLERGAMDERRLERIKRRAATAIEDLSSAGMIGVAAMRACIDGFDRIVALDPQNAGETLERLRAHRRELEAIKHQLEAPRHANALQMALGRFLTVIQAAAEGALV